MIESVLANIPWAKPGGTITAFFPGSTVALKVFPYVLESFLRSVAKSSIEPLRQTTNLPCALDPS